MKPKGVMSAVCASVRVRLTNWKFSQAKNIQDYEELPTEVRDVIDALAACFGDIGWTESNMAMIISCAVDSADRMLHNIEMGRSVDSPDPS